MKSSKAKAAQAAKKAYVPPAMRKAMGGRPANNTVTAKLLRERNTGAVVDTPFGLKHLSEEEARQKRELAAAKKRERKKRAKAAKKLAKEGGAGGGGRKGQQQQPSHAGGSDGTPYHHSSLQRDP